MYPRRELFFRPAYCEAMSKMLWAGALTLDDVTGREEDWVWVSAPFCSRVTERLDHELAAGELAAEHTPSLRELRRWYVEYGDGMPLGYEWWVGPGDTSGYTDADWDRLDAESAARTLALADALQAVLERWPACWLKDRVRLEATIRGIRFIADKPQLMLTIF